MKDPLDLKDLTIHDVQPISIHSRQVLFQWSRMQSGGVGRKAGVILTQGVSEDIKPSERSVSSFPKAMPFAH